MWSSPDSFYEEEPFRLNAQASAAILDDDLDSTNSSVGATSKHPRHRVGCTCIVCVQPSSGKGNHKRSCTHLACMTTKPRFNTTMKGKRKRRLTVCQTLEGDTNGASLLENEGSMNRGGLEVDELGAGQLDLNCHPNHEDMPMDVWNNNMFSTLSKFEQYFWTS